MTDARVALVTGAARGIGAATVHRLCSSGYRVVAVDSCSADATETSAGIRYALASRSDLDAIASAYPEQVLPIVADVRDVNVLRDAAAQAMHRWGRLDAAVAAAAVIIGGDPLWETPQEHLTTLIDVDIVGVWNTATAVIPHMLRSTEPHGCRFVAVASAAGSYGLFHLAGYNVAKHGVIGLVRGLAADLVGSGVTAVAVSPGSTETEMLNATADLYGLPDTAAFVESSPLRRILHPNELAATIEFCCSVEGAVLNGSVVEASGGFRG